MSCENQEPSLQKYAELSFQKYAELFALMTEAMGMLTHDFWAIKYGTEGPYTNRAYTDTADAMRDIFKEGK